MKRRVLLLSAGSVASNNLVRSLKSGDPSITVVACADNRFALKRSLADENYLVSASTHLQLARTLNRIVKAERIDLLIPNSETDVKTVSMLRERLKCRTFLPRHDVIELCEDKFELNVLLRRKGIAVPATHAVENIDRLEEVFLQLSRHPRLWCRIRNGSGSIGAVPVTSPVQARWWIKYWEDMRDVPPGMFTLSEYLPGRDITVQCLFRNGSLILAKMLHRLTYNVIGGGPSGVSSTASLARMIYEPRIAKTCVAAVTALDAKATGAYSVDLKENARGKACVTEVNAGRFANGPVVHDLAGPPNTVLTYLRLALGEAVKPIRPRRYTEDCFIMRHLDIAPAVLRASELAHGVKLPPRT